jgi:hypothetical protein
VHVPAEAVGASPFLRREHVEELVARPSEVELDQLDVVRIELEMPREGLRPAPRHGAMLARDRGGRRSGR